MSRIRQRADALFTKYLQESTPSLLELSVRLAFSSRTSDNAALSIVSASTHALELVFQLDQSVLGLNSTVSENNVDPRQAFTLASLELVDFETLITSLGLPSQMPNTIFKQKILDQKSLVVPVTSSDASQTQKTATYHIVAFAVPAASSATNPEDGTSSQEIFSITKLLKIDLSEPLDDESVLPRTIKYAISPEAHDKDKLGTVDSDKAVSERDPAWRRVAAQAWFEPWHEITSKIGHRDVGLKTVTELAVLRLMERDEMDDRKRATMDKELQARLTRHLLRRASELQS
ncbi:hypothetical protein OIV83_002052 [Microbotryomycetes sp. JL201]|nr:hypothetical protein OIV83_002052 [Microbotryomycetes sp. JL201]